MILTGKKGGVSRAVKEVVWVVVPTEKMVKEGRGACRILGSSPAAVLYKKRESKGHVDRRVK